MTPAQFYARFRSTMFGIPVPDLPETPPQPDDDLDPLMREYVSGQRMASPNVDRQSASIVQVESSKLMPWLLLSCLISGIAISVAVITMRDAQRTERETRMLEYYLLELDARVIRYGIKSDDEAISKKLAK